MLKEGHINTYGESGFDYEILRSVMNRGRNIRMATGVFGGYQAIMKKDGVYYGASEFRDRQTAGYEY